MDYKKLIPNQETRLKLLGLTEFIPDSLMIKLQYRVATGRSLNLKKPKRYTEKLQWYKLHYRDPLMTQCADKYRVREYVASKGYEDILIPLYGVYKRVDEIQFENLPDEFVFKTNNGSGTNILCRNKEKLDEEQTKKQLDSWLVRRTVKAGREWPYYNINPKIICEKLLEDSTKKELVDYKFLCFDGKVSKVIVNADRDAEDGMLFNIYDREFSFTSYGRKGLRRNKNFIEKPKNYEVMVEIAEALSKDFPHVRVDLYNIMGEIYFGELTFFHGSGYVDFEPDEFDFKLGEKFQLPVVF